MTFARTILAVALSTAVLTGCQSSEERAEDYYQSALEYLDEGDVDRAIIELRNVFQNDGFHRDARSLYADLLQERGDIEGAYSQLLRLVEQYPDDLDARLTLAELALARNDWQEATRHGERAIAIAPDDPRVRAVSAALDYRQAALDEDAQGRTAAAETAAAVLAEIPDSTTARSVLLSQALQNEDTGEAMRLVDETLASLPGRLDLQFLKAQLL